LAQSRSCGIRGRPAWVPRDAFVVDLHFHSDASSDGRMTPRQIVQWCRANGYDGVALTDHNSVANLSEIRRIAAEIDPDFVVIPGVEWSTMRFHANVLGVTSFGHRESYLQWPSLEDIAEEGDRARRQGGLIQYNHPRDVSCFGLSGDDVLRARFDAVEIVSGVWDLRDDRKAVDFCSRHGLAMTGGSDTHIPGQCPLVYTEILGTDHSVAGILRAIRRGAVVVHSRKDSNGYRQAQCGLITPIVSTLTDLIRLPFKMVMKQVLPIRKLP
jgi:predicted metal-dependent phosphoesterase TrpH